jgi:pyrroline-5-carboxylate reductase
MKHWKKKALRRLVRSRSSCDSSVAPFLFLLLCEARAFRSKQQIHTHIHTHTLSLTRRSTQEKQINYKPNNTVIMNLLSSETKIGFIGSGQMSTAIMKGLIQSKTLEPTQIYATDVVKEQLTRIKQSLNVQIEESNVDLICKCDTVILAVKPNQAELLLKEVFDALQKKKPLFISICAGLDIAFFEQRMPSGSRIARVMPNVNCLVGEAASAFCMSKNAIPNKDDVIVKQIFSSVGVIEHTSEYLMDAVTGLSGSGPAYVFMFIEALADGGVRAGLPRPIALKLAAQTVLGSAKNVLQTEMHPGVLKDMVCSPSGTTISGVHALEKGNLRATVMNAVLEATRRSKELGTPDPKL